MSSELCGPREPVNSSKWLIALPWDRVSVEFVGWLAGFYSTKSGVSTFFHLQTPKQFRLEVRAPLANADVVCGPSGVCGQQVETHCTTLTLGMEQLVGCICY